MKERQRWRPEEDALLRSYVKQYGPRDWHLVSDRMNKPLDRDSKSCLERWKNYLKPGIKKGSLTEEEQCHVIQLQAKHGNKWKKIAAEVPGRTAKRLGKWWEVFKEKQLREHKESNRQIEPIDEGKYNHILETFAEKLITMPTSNGNFIHNNNNNNNNQIAPPPPSALPPWLAAGSSTTVTVRQPPSPSVTLSLSPVGPAIPWLQSTTDHNNNNTNNTVASELVDCCRELEEGHRALASHRKEAAWRLKRVELQLESEKACRRREKMEEIEAKVHALREEQKATLDRIEAEYREQLAGLRREAEVKEQKLAEQWAAKHLRLTKFLEQMGCRSMGGDHPPNAR
ncbi:hypothetical protein ABFS82_12G167700 [Erythranthe guttata]